MNNWQRISGGNIAYLFLTYEFFFATCPSFLYGEGFVSQNSSQIINLDRVMHRIAIEYICPPLLPGVYLHAFTIHMSGKDQALHSEKAEILAVDRFYCPRGSPGDGKLEIEQGKGDLRNGKHDATYKHGNTCVFKTADKFQVNIDGPNDLYSAIEEKKILPAARTARIDRDCLKFTQERYPA